MLHGYALFVGAICIARYSMRRKMSCIEAVLLFAGIVLITWGVK